MEEKLTHIDAQGSMTMVDVGGKHSTARRAIAGAIVELAPATMDLLRRKALPKGDVLACAKVAGILAAKRTGELIPLCHPLPLSFVDVDFCIEGDTVRIQTEARCTGPTGVEMEAIVAAQVAAATIYDMCKAVQRDIVIRDVRLLHKSGGRRGTYNAEGFLPPSSIELSSVIESSSTIESSGVSMKGAPAP
jgi:cyclic pyranopterin phosphate synthase